MKFFLTLPLVFCFCVNTIFSQEVSKEIAKKIDGKANCYDFTNEGFFYIKYNKDDSHPKDKRGTVEVYNPNLALEYTYDVNDKFYIKDITANGDQIMSKLPSTGADYVFLNNDGDKAEYESFNKIIPKGFSAKRKYLVKDNLYLFCYDKSTKEKINNSKRKFTYSYHVIKLNLKTGEHKMIDFNLPKINSSDEVVEFFPLESFNSNSNFSFLTKKYSDFNLEVYLHNFLRTKKQSISIMNYDENFEFVNTNNLDVEINEDTDLYYALSNLSKDAYSKHSRIKSDGSQSEFFLPEMKATGDVFKGAEGNLYTYSVVSSNKDKSIKNDKEENGGVFINKFDASGKLLWKKTINIPRLNDKRPIYGLYTYVNIEETKDDLIISYNNLHHKTKFGSISVLDNKNGALKEQTFFPKVAIETFNEDRKLLNPKTQKSLYQIKENFGELIVDEKTIMAYGSNEKVKNFIDARKDKKVTLLSSIHQNYILTAEINNDKKVYKLHRFDL